MEDVKNISSALDSYLQRSSTPYAVMMDGSWGIGKTHFMLNTFIPEHPRFEFGYVSLYGLSSVEELQAKIETVLSSNRRNSASRLIAVGSIGAEPETNSEQELQLRNLSATCGRVICFDDLERWYGDLELCLSCINELVENEQAKCIVIGNLDEMSERSLKSFYRACEKTIRHVYRYESNYRDILDIALGLVDYESPSSQSFLQTLVQDNFDQLARFLDRVNIRNIRVITEALQLYEYVFRNNSRSFRSARQLAFTYLMTTISMLALVKRYFVEKSSRNKLLKGDHATTKGFRFLSDIGYFKDDASSCLTAESRILLDTIFYRLDQVSLKGICSIVQHGYYIAADFEDDFKGWCEEENYDLYLDKDRFLELDDNRAKEIFDNTLKTLLDDRLITNPVTFLLIAERIVDDISSGLVDYNPVEFRKQVIESAGWLYDSGKMKPMDISIFDATGDRFTNCRAIYNYMMEHNRDYQAKIAEERLARFWEEVIAKGELPANLPQRFSPGEVFSFTRDIEELITSLEALDNAQLHRFANWIEGDPESIDKFLETRDGEVFQATLVSAIRSRYGEETGVRANHFRRIAEVLKRAGRGQDPDYRIADSIFLTEASRNY